MRPTIALVVIFLPALTGAQRVERAETRQPIRISYGMVDTIVPTKLQSQAGSNAVVGGVVGAALTHDRRDRGRNAAIGALAAGLITAAAEGRHRVDEITITMRDGSVLKVIQDHLDGIQPRACVAVEQGVHTNVRSVSSEHCGTSALVADSSIIARRTDDADACALAKEELARAQNDQQFEFASRKIRVLCH